MKGLNVGWFVIVLVVLISCHDQNGRLPILGEQRIEDGDTIYHQVEPFSYLDQDSNQVSQQTLQDKIYVADFFFTSCPTICPKVTAQMLRIQEEFIDEDRLKLLSYSIDYRKDSIPILKRYASKVGISSAKWHLVQLKKDEVERVANQYFSVAFEDSSVPGGFDHSGRLMLVDQHGRIRAYCNGTEPDEVTEFMEEIRILLNEG